MVPSRRAAYLFYWVFQSFLAILSSQNISASQDILSAIFEGYDPLVPPASRVLDEVNIFVNSLHSVQESTMDYQITIFLHQRWEDQRLNYSHFSNTSLAMHGADGSIDKVWKPDIYFDNEKSSQFHSVTTENRGLRLSPDGQVFYSIRLSLKLSCPMMLSYFPTDSHECPIVMLSYAYTSDELVVQWRKEDPVLIFSENKLPQFVIKQVTTMAYTKDYGTVGWSFLEARFHLDRLVGYYLLTIYVPSSLLVSISWVSFWLHPDSTAARIALGITTILTITTQSAWARQQIPAISYATALDIWMSTCICFVMLALLEFATVNYLHLSAKRKSKRSSLAQGKEKNQLVAKYEQNKVNGGVILNRFKKTIDDSDEFLDRMKRHQENSQIPDNQHWSNQSQESTQTSGQSSPHPSHSSDDFSSQISIRRGRSGPSHVGTPERIDLGLRIDSLARGVFPASFLIFICCYWLYLKVFR